MSRTYFENGRPVPASKGLRSRWDFAPNEDRVRDIVIHPIYTTGVMKGMIANYHANAYNHKLNKVRAYLRNRKNSLNENSCVTLDFPRKV